MYNIPFESHWSSKTTKGIIILRDIVLKCETEKLPTHLNSQISLVHPRWTIAHLASLALHVHLKYSQSYEVVCQLAPLGSKVLTTCTECVITTGGNISPEIYIFTKLTAYSKFLYNLCITQLQWNLTLPSISALPTSKVFKNFIKICSSVISPFWYFGCILTL